MRRNQPTEASLLPTLVFLHGNSFDGGVFEELMDHPSLTGRDVIALDLPGHGQSACLPPSVQYSFVSMADRVMEAIENAGISEVILVGWSLGGHVSLELLDRSPRVKGAIICGTPIMPNNPIAALFAMHFTVAMLLTSKRNFTHTDAVRFERLTLGAKAKATHLQAILQADGRARTEIAHSMLLGANRDQRNLALSAGKRLCIINTLNDPIARTDYIARFAGEPEFTGLAMSMESAGNAAFLDQPDEFLAAISSFEASLSEQAKTMARAA